MQRHSRICVSVLWAVPALAGVVSLAGCVSARAKVAELTVEPHVVESVERFKKEYVLAPGDQIEITVRRVPELSRTQIIRPDGNITLPVVNQLKAAGLTAVELNTKLEELFAARLVAPEITVIPTLVRQPVVYVSGDVASSIAVPLRDAPTVIQAITLAGGFRRSAAARDVAIIRLNGDGHLQATTIPVGDRSQPAPFMALRAAPLQADDIVFVPESGRSQMARFLDDFINRPLQGVTGVVGTFESFKLISYISKVTP